MTKVSHVELEPRDQVRKKHRFGWFQAIKASLEKISLAQRMLVSSALVLFVFLGGAALMLNTVFSISLEGLAREKLTLHTYQLISIGDRDTGTMELPKNLLEPRFNQNQGSLIAYVTELQGNGQQREVWRSLSAEGKHFTFPAPNAGKWFFGRAQGANGSQYYVSSYNTTWSNDEGSKTKYVFTVMENYDLYQKELAKYRIAILIGLLTFGFVFLMLQVIILRFGLAPVRRIAADVNAMNNGDIASLTRQYPEELKPLTTNLNLLLDNERRQRERYRDRMADLSHSLKTPLSVLKGVESDIDGQGRPISRQSVLDILMTQVHRMSNIVEHQLQRAITNGAPTVFSAIDVAGRANDIIIALNKVHSNKAIDCALKIDKGLTFYGDENDLVEILGNLLDNAFKHGQKTVRLSGARTTPEEGGVPQLLLVFEDDGDGVPSEKRAAILRRGVRLDSSGEGQGFGLSIVVDIVSSYQGALTIKESSLGGASFVISIPTR